MTSSAIAILTEAKRKKLADIERIEQDNKDVLGRARNLLDTMAGYQFEVDEMDEAIEALTHPPKKPVTRSPLPGVHTEADRPLDEFTDGTVERPEVEQMNVGGVGITRRRAE